MNTVTHAYISKTGNRAVNEDAFLCVRGEGSALYAVADGLGGHGKGDLASASAVRTMRLVFEENPGTPPEELLDRAIRQAQENLLREQEELNAREEMKTTVAALCCDGKTVCWAHVGDTRVYGFQNNRVRMRTLDHSVPQMLVLSGEIPERKIRNHPDRNRLLRAMGTEWDRPKHEISDPEPVGAYQAFLLCSDGFWELISERQMGWLLRGSDSPEQWLEKMTAVVEKRGRNRSMDNYTAVAVWI